jgi:hypothetical protein
MALALFADEDYEEVAARLAGTFADWDGWEESWDRASTSGGITQAPQRLGPEPLKELFAQLARPVADMVTAGAFLGRRRLMSIDGIGVGRPGHGGERGVLRVSRDREGQGTGSVSQGQDGGGQRVRVARGSAGRDRPVRLQRQRRAVAGPQPLPAAGGGLAADRRPELPQLAGLVRRRGQRCRAAVAGQGGPAAPGPGLLPDGSYRSVLVSPKVTGAARKLLIEAARNGRELDSTRARHVRVIEYEVPDRDGPDELIALVTTIADLREAPAAALAAAYHRRWEHEGANAQVKTFLRGPGKILRSQSPPMVEQELWGYLLTHYAISALTCTAATAAGIDPDRVRPKRTIRAVRRRVADPAFPP